MTFSSHHANDPSTPSAAPLTLGTPLVPAVTPFVERRSTSPSRGAAERRQFGSTHFGLSPAGRKLALAIDQYKLEHHRRYITCDEMLEVISALGYQQP